LLIETTSALTGASNTGSCLPSIITSLLELCIFEQ